ncbi:ATP-binding protein [Amycolatopsis cihanbeyliensis]|uniref:Tetratricopeptide repeat protein n=1 Tax=Amycolatopsis cihanbeyliensis TaxID=1128664 RepID=A0A542CS83_AMYCI|nr:helix-turn-helix domain-containing protein [Amycolatopsis cihanbeyliensis]TQI93677.1 tetratricopeptide repeat protein [Amycolatopsis cihanbeyliensis]
MSDRQDTFGAELRRLRLAAGLSLTRLAERVHYSKGYLSKVETGAAAPNMSLALLCDAEFHTAGALVALVPDGRQRRQQVPRPPAPSLPAPPPVTAHFTGRARELGQIRAVLLDDGAVASRVCVLSGMAGVGKTTLAARVAHRLEGRFTDGCLFLDLRGHTPDATEVSPAEALDRCLRVLGVPGEEIPRDVDDRAGVYRNRLRGRRFLIVLDNVRSARQVVPLLPAEPNCRVLVTSRNRLHALDDAQHIMLDTMPEAEAAALFRRVVGTALPPPGTDEHTDRLLARIGDRCGRLPLAVRIAAARYRGNPTWTPDELATRLADEQARLVLLDDGERSVTAAFRLSYHGLPVEQRHMFTVLALHPGQDIDLRAAGVLAGIDLTAAERALTGLHDANLLVQRAPDRYQFHDLLRVFATHGAVPPPQRQAAVGRLIDFALAGAERASALLAPHRSRPEVRLGPLPVEPAPLRDIDAALAWFTAEWPNLVALCRLAAEGGPRERCWQLAFSLRDFFFLTKLRQPWIETHSLAVAAAKEAGDDLARAGSLNNLGVPHLELGDLDAAAACYREALGLFRALGDGPGISGALANNAWVTHHRGEHQAAVRDLRLALDFYERHGLPRNAAITLRGIALIEAESGAVEHAVEHALTALRSCQELGLDLDAAMTLNCLGLAYYRSGRWDQAARAYRQARTLGEGVGSRHETARAETGLGNLAAARGDRAAAERHWTRARQHYPDLSTLRVAEARDRLAERSRTVTTEEAAEA